MSVTFSICARPNSSGSFPPETLSSSSSADPNPAESPSLETISSPTARQLYGRLESLGRNSPTRSDPIKATEIFAEVLGYCYRKIQKLEDTTTWIPKISYQGWIPDQKKLLEKVIKVAGDDLPRCSPYAKSLLGLLSWSEWRKNNVPRVARKLPKGSGDSSGVLTEARFEPLTHLPTETKKVCPSVLFLQVAQSKNGALEDKFQGYFNYCHFELNREEPVNLDYIQLRACLKYSDVPENKSPIYRKITRLYLALFHLQGLGGVPPSLQEAKKLLMEWSDEPVLSKKERRERSLVPEKLRQIGRLMLAEFHILGLADTPQDFLKGLSLIGSYVFRLDDRPSKIKAKILYWIAIFFRKIKGRFYHESNVKFYFKKAYQQLMDKDAGDMELAAIEECLEKGFELNWLSQVASSVQQGPPYETCLGLHLAKDLPS